MTALQDVRAQLLARAAALGIAAPSEEAAIDTLLDRELAVSAPTDADCHAYYERHRGTHFAAGALVEADHILFAVTSAAPLAALRQRATEVLEELLRDPERFAARAAELSNCPSGAIGGSLGQLARGDVVPEFWQALVDAPAGIVPRLVESRFGLHIVRVARQIPGRLLPYEAVRERIAVRLAEHRLRVALRDYAHGLLHAAHSGTH